MTKIKAHEILSLTVLSLTIPLLSHEYAGNILVSAEEKTVFDWLRRASSEKSGLVGESLEKAG